MRKNRVLILMLAAICSISIMATSVRAEMKYTNDENVRNFVRRLYQVILNREADENGLNAWTKQLLDRKATGAQLVCGFVESDEFTQRGLTNEEVVEIMYLAMLDRASDDVGREGWSKILNGGCSYVYIVNGFAGSAEFNGICNTYGIDAGIVDTDRKRDRNPQLTQFVSRCYTQALGREYETSGLENWCDAIISGRNTPKQAAQMFIFSDEFLQKNLSNEEYVKVLYRTFMGREADEGGLVAWVEVLESGREDRMKVLEGFSDSVEFAGILESFGLYDKGQATVEDWYNENRDKFAAIEDEMNASSTDGKMSIYCESNVIVYKLEMYENLFDGGEEMNALIKDIFDSMFEEQKDTYTGLIDSVSEASGVDTSLISIRIDVYDPTTVTKPGYSIELRK